MKVVVYMIELDILSSSTFSGRS